MVIGAEKKKRAVIQRLLREIPGLMLGSEMSARPQSAGEPTRLHENTRISQMHQTYGHQKEDVR